MVMIFREQEDAPRAESCGKDPRLFSEELSERYEYISALI